MGPASVKRSCRVSLLTLRSDSLFREQTVADDHRASLREKKEIGVRELELDNVRIKTTTVKLIVKTILRGLVQSQTKRSKILKTVVKL